MSNAVNAADYVESYQENVSIKGRIDGLSYLDGNTKKEKENTLLNKLFK